MITLDPRRTVTVAIDMHRGHLDPTVATLPLPPERCGPVIARASALFHELRAIGVPIVHVVTEYREPGEIATNPFWQAVHDDPEKARAILKQAGYRDLSIDFVLMKDLYPKQLEIAQAVAAMLADVGVKLNIRNLEIATAREARTAGTYDMFFSGWAHLPHDPDWYLGQWFTKAGAEKLTRFNDPRVEQLVAEGRVPDPKVRQQKYEELQRILWEDEPEIWPYYSVAIYAISDRLQGFEARGDYYVLLSEVAIK